MFMSLKRLITHACLILALHGTLLGCSTIPQGASFPELPATLAVQPSDSDLILLPEDRVLLLSEIVDASKRNYATGYGYRVQVEELLNWIRDQRKNFNGK